MTAIAVFRFPKEGEITFSASQKKGHREPACDIPPSQMLRTSSFWLYYVWVALLTGAGLILIGQASGIAEEVGRGLSGNTIATVVGMISITNAIGRICNGTVFDRYGYHGTMTMVLSTFAFSAVMMLMAYQTGFFPLLVIGFMTGGFAYGAFCSTSPALMSDFYGRTWYSINFSIIPTNTLFTSFATVIAGRLYDSTNSFYSSILLLFAFVIASVFLAFVIRRPGEHKVTASHTFRHHRRHKHHGLQMA
jgi:OFA family oxalate/formate antiporter-like MFS transporter